jgi:hypothetical protein
MHKAHSKYIVDDSPSLVKPRNISDSSQVPDLLIQHNVSPYPRRKIILSYSMLSSKPYAVSPARRVFSPQALLKRLDVVREGLQIRIGLTDRQAEAAIRLLKLWAYYGQVYPKASQVAGEPEISDTMASWRAEQGLGPAPQNDGVSRATFWRTIRILEDLGLVSVVNRYVIREHARISNLYRLDQLVLVLARYIAERREFDGPAWLDVIFRIPGPEFWAFLARAPGDRAGPALPALEDLLSSRVTAA